MYDDLRSALKSFLHGFSRRAAKNSNRWTLVRLQETHKQLKAKIELSELPLTIHSLYLHRSVAQELGIFPHSFFLRPPDDEKLRLKDLPLNGEVLHVFVVNPLNNPEVEFGVGGYGDIVRLRDAEDFLNELFAMTALS